MPYTSAGQGRRTGAACHAVAVRPGDRGGVAPSGEGLRNRICALVCTAIGRYYLRVRERNAETNLNTFDIQLLESLNQFARSAPVLDVVIVFITRSYLFKGGVMMTFLWWGWFRPGPDQERKRLALTSVLFAALGTLLAARLLALTLPHRVRPMQDAEVDMVLPIGMAPMLQGWSSFPSDHAALFGCLASGMFLVSRRAGWLASAYCFFVILLPRVYTGLHFPSDILVGYGLGAFMTWSVSRRRPMEICIRPAFDWLMARPQVWYPLFFLVSYEIATLFDDVRNLGTLVYRIIDWMLENN